MARCGCAGTACPCVIVGSNTVNVTGAGTAGNPFVIETVLPFLTCQERLQIRDDLVTAGMPIGTATLLSGYDGSC